MFTNSEIAFITDSILRGFENRELAYLFALDTESSHSELFERYFKNHELIPFFRNLHCFTKKLISQNVTIAHRGQITQSERVNFHEKHGWIVENKIGKAFLGKISFSANIQIEIGHLSFFSGNCELHGKGKLKIGSYCSFARNLRIQTSNISHHLDYMTTYDLDSDRGTILGSDNQLPPPEKINRRDGVRIGHDVWLGEDVSLMNGISLGDGSVVGMKSLVTRDTEPYGIYAGTPAKLIRYRFDQQRIDELLELQWWDWSAEKLTTNKDLFHFDLTQFKDKLIETGIK